MNLAQLRARFGELQADATTIIDAAEAGDGTFSEEQESQLAAIEAEMDEVKAKIEAKEALDARRRTMSARVAGVALAATTALTPALANQVHDSDPALTGDFASLGEFATAVHGAVQAANRGGRMDERLAALADTHEGGTSDGEGYSLPPAYRDQVWEIVSEFDDFGQLIDEEPTSNREVKLNADETTPWSSSGIVAYWRDEGDKMNLSKLSQEGRTVPLHELYAMAAATEELLEDAARLENRLTRKAGEAIAFAKSLAIHEGSGVGQPLGWDNSASQLVIAKEVGQTAGSIDPRNIVKMYQRLYRMPGDRPFWLINQNCLSELMLMVVGDRPIWMPSTDLSNAPGGTLLGIPVRFSEFAEPLGNAGDIHLISPKGYYGVRRSSGIQAASSIHLFFDYNTRAFRWIYRYGGQPKYSKPVVPLKGGETRSCFLKLEERA